MSTEEVGDSLEQVLAQRYWTAKRFFSFVSASNLRRNAVVLLLGLNAYYYSEVENEIIIQRDELGCASRSYTSALFSDPILSFIRSFEF